MFNRKILQGVHTRQIKAVDGLEHFEIQSAIDQLAYYQHGMGRESLGRVKETFSSQNEHYCY